MTTHRAPRPPSSRGPLEVRRILLLVGLALLALATAVLVYLALTSTR